MADARNPFAWEWPPQEGPSGGDQTPRPRPRPKPTPAVMPREEMLAAHARQYMANTQSSDPQDYSSPWELPYQHGGPRPALSAGEPGEYYQLPTPWAMPPAAGDQPYGPHLHLDPGAKLRGDYPRMLQPISDVRGPGASYSNLITGPWQRRGVEVGGGMAPQPKVPPQPKVQVRELPSKWKNTRSFYIETDGKPTVRVDTDRNMDGKSINVKDIYGVDPATGKYTPEAYKGAIGSLGTRGIRSAADALRQYFPGAERIAGWRATGARERSGASAKNQTTRVPLRTGDVDTSFTARRDAQRLSERKAEADAMARKEQETMAQAGESFAKARTARLAREEERRQASTRFLSEYSGPRRVTDELLVERALGDTLGPPRAAQRGHYITQSIADPEGISGSLYTNPATGATRLTARTARGNVELPFASRIAALRFIRHRHGDPLDYDKLINTARTLRQLYGIGEHTGDAFLK